MMGKVRRALGKQHVQTGGPLDQTEQYRSLLRGLVDNRKQLRRNFTDNVGKHTLARIIERLPAGQTLFDQRAHSNFRL